MSTQIHLLSQVTTASGERFNILQLAHNRFAVQDSRGNVTTQCNSIGDAWEGLKYVARLHPVHGHSPAVECTKGYYSQKGAAA